jgi:hypothetical protein
MVGFWLWLAGLPVSHDTVCEWLAGEPPRAQAAEIGGTITTDTTIDSATTVNPDLTVNSDVTLTGVAPNTNTLYNNGSILNLASFYTNLNLVNNGNFTFGIPDDRGGIYTTISAPVNWTNNGTMNIDNGFIYFSYNGFDGGNNIFDNSGAGNRQRYILPQRQFYLQQQKWRQDHHQRGRAVVRRL